MHAEDLTSSHFNVIKNIISRTLYLNTQLQGLKLFIYFWLKNHVIRVLNMTIKAFEEDLLNMVTL